LPAIGALNKRVELFAAARSDDGAGGFTRAAASLGTFFAQVRPATWSEQRNAERNEQRVSHVVTLRRVRASSALSGVTASDLYPGVDDSWNDAGTLDLVSASGALVSVTEAEALNGANAIAITNADGEDEVLIFQNAALVSGSTYRVTRLIRGLFDTESAWASPVAAGAAWREVNVAFSGEFGEGGWTDVSADIPLQGGRVRWTDHAGRTREAYIHTVVDPDEDGRFIELGVEEGGPL
jgi:head-tail adaptor